MQPTTLVILPDGRLDRDGARFVNEDVEVTPIEFPVVSSVPAQREKYEHARLEGYGHRQAILVTKHGELASFVDATDPVAWGKVVSEMDDHDFASICRMGYGAFCRYRDMRSNGQSHNMAEILATRSFPGVKTDAVFNEGKFSGQSTGECDARGAWLRQQAESVGVSTTGKWYCSGLASFPGDPTAWVDGRGEVLRIAREKNLTVHGYVEHDGYETDPGSDVVIADDIIEGEVADILESNPGSDPEHVRSEVYALRSGAVDPNPLVVED